ncbi:MAG: SWIM zinc finger family protein [Desulfosalsimonadaceae bacterium]
MKHGAVLMRPIEDICRELTWGGLMAWASRRTVIEGRKIQQRGVVNSLMTVRQGRGLLAWVDAEEPFAVMIELEDDGDLFSSCTCNPMESPCEHAVAVLIEYIACLQHKVPVPAAESNDPRFYLI